MMRSVRSKNNVPVRLTSERWAHIIEEHCELAGLREDVLETISEPLMIVKGNRGEKLAVKKVGNEKYLVAVYREMHDDGFIITAFLTKRYQSLTKRKQLWPQ